MRTADLMRLVEFLVPPGDDPAAYRRQLAAVRDQIKALEKVGHPATKLTLGGKVKELEDAARKYLDVKHALLLTNATAGFEIAYKLAGIGPGDEVIVPAIHLHCHDRLSALGGRQGGAGRPGPEDGEHGTRPTWHGRSLPRRG